MRNNSFPPLQFDPATPINLAEWVTIERKEKDEKGEPRHKDFTVFIEAKYFYQALKNARPKAGRFTDAWATLEDRCSFDFDQPVTLRVTGAPTEDLTYKGRIHAVRCCKNTAFSVTFRSLQITTEKKLPKPTGLFDLEHRKLDCAYDVAAKEWTKDLSSLENALDPSEGPYIVAEPVPDPKFFRRTIQDADYETLRQTPKYLTHSLHSDTIAFSLLFGSREGLASGLLLISGETGCGKTTFLNGLLRKYWHETVLPKYTDRRPHMVVIGDPIETSFYDELSNKAKKYPTSAKCQMELGHKRYFDVTERVLGIDTPSIKDALHDALRETPKLVVVGELREDDDFLAALEFAATGHLIISTSHNTSLMDTMGKLMRISNTKTAADRANLAQRLLGIVHLIPHQEKIDPVPGKTELTLRANVPAVWRANAKGIRNFVSEGLSSFIAHNPFNSNEKGADAPVLGRAWFIHQLRRQETTDLNKKTHWETVTKADPFDQFKNALQALDLHSF